MGRALRRQIERQERLSNPKFAVSFSDLHDLKEKERERASAYSVEALMTCFALAEHNLYGFGNEQIMQSLQYIDDLMEKVNSDEATIEEYKKQLADEVSIEIRC